mmetsp:Transcript_44854/g.129622  ORF Transcript_44854/g.129622 Transcript_44854/m.129622 type:complete len:271 (+) Transcript_44854:950-1762(+)
MALVQKRLNQPHSRSILLPGGDLPLELRLDEVVRGQRLDLRREAVAEGAPLYVHLRHGIRREGAYQLQAVHIQHEQRRVHGDGLRHLSKLPFRGAEQFPLRDFAKRGVADDEDIAAILAQHVDGHCFGDAVRGASCRTVRRRGLRRSWPPDVGPQGRDAGGLDRGLRGRGHEALRLWWRLGGETGAAKADLRQGTAADARRRCECRRRTVGPLRRSRPLGTRRRETGRHDRGRNRVHLLQAIWQPFGQRRVWNILNGDCGGIARRALRQH